MQNNILQGEDYIQANAIDIIKKFRSQQDRINFRLEKNWFYPKEPGYDAMYFLLVLTGKKISSLQLFN